METSIQGSCTDPDGDSLDVILYRNDEQIATGNDPDHEETIVEDATYRIEATDPSGATGSASQEVTGFYDQVAFFSDRDGTRGIYVGDLQVDVDGNYTSLDNIRILTDRPDSIYPTYSSDGGEIIFTSRSDSIDNHAIFIMDADDGSNLEDISSHLSGAEAMAYPDVCSNGEIAVRYFANGMTEAGIGIINSDRDTFTSVYTETNNNPISRPPGFPSWNDNCSQVVFEKYDNDWDVWRVDRNGSNLVNLTNHPAVDGQPDYSPDGQKIVFQSDSSGVFDLYKMDPDGSDLSGLPADSGRREVDSRFSPDGNYIVSSSREINGSRYDVEIRKSDGTEIVRLTSEENNRDPTFRPRQE